MFDLLLEVPLPHALAGAGDSKTEAYACLVEETLRFIELVAAGIQSR